MLKYFSASFLVTLLGLILSAGVGVYYGGGDLSFSHALPFALKAVLTTAILAALEISLSFDNAVVNATILREMTPLWRHRFLTWGMVVAVFGMRIVFPLVTVAVLAETSPWDALQMALFRPDEYAKVMLSAHHEVSAFGGAFLLLVALKYFFDDNEEIHWIRFIENPLSKLGKLEAAEVAVTLAVVWALSKQLTPEHAFKVMGAGIAGVLTFIFVDALNVYLKAPENPEGLPTDHSLHRASLGMFLYLEVLDSSFSFDGVVGAFAVTNNLLIIAIGLGIGAMFVRSLTIMLVEKNTLSQFVFLEHGAFYAIGALAAIMFANVVTEVPEWIAGTVGASFIGLSILSSLRHQKKKGHLVDP